MEVSGQLHAPATLPPGKYKLYPGKEIRVDGIKLKINKLF
jgi:hypothetical protein